MESPNWKTPDWKRLRWKDPQTEDSPDIALSVIGAAFWVAMGFHSKGNVQGTRNALAVALAWLDRYHELGGKEQTGLRERLERIRALPGNEWESEIEGAAFKQFMAQITGGKPEA